MQNSESHDTLKSVADVSGIRPDSEEINFLDYLIVLLKHKRLIISITFGFAVITALISLVMPTIYRAETRILPPQQNNASIAAGMLSQIAGGSISDIASSALGLKTPADLYIGMIKSRTVADRIIDRFNLMKLYDEEYREDARKELLEDILEIVSDENSGIITVSIEDKDPKRAAEIANAFVDELKNLTKGLAVTEAAQRRLFFEEQLKDTKTSLMNAEESMKSFQEKTGVLEVEEQAKAVIEGIASLRAQIAAKEVEIRVMRTFSTPNNPDMQKTVETLRGLKEELNKLEVKSGGGHDPIIPTGRMPEVGTEYGRKLRDLKFNETLFELLTKQYEAAKLDEAREAALIQIIDTATTPEKKAKPKRALMIITAIIVGLFFSIFLAIFKEYKERAINDPGNKVRLDEIKKHFKLFYKSRKDKN